jgi:hypothetical protein
MRAALARRDLGKLRVHFVGRTRGGFHPAGEKEKHMSTATEAPTLAQKMKAASEQKAAAARKRYAEYLFKFDDLDASGLAEMHDAMRAAGVGPGEAENDRRLLEDARAAIAAGDAAEIELRDKLEPEMEKLEAKIEKAAGTFRAAAAALDDLIVIQKQALTGKITNAKFAVQDRGVKKFRLQGLFPT